MIVNKFDCISKGLCAECAVELKLNDATVVELQVDHVAHRLPPLLVRHVPQLLQYFAIVIHLRRAEIAPDFEPSYLNPEFLVNYAKILQLA